MTWIPKRERRVLSLIVVAAMTVGLTGPQAAFGASEACCTPNQGDQSNDPVCDMKDPALCIAPSKPQGGDTDCVDDPLDSDTVAEACENMCPHPNCAVPTVSEWGLAVMTLLVLVAGSLLLVRRRYAA